jgi:hypothetical protein
MEENWKSEGIIDEIEKGVYAFLKPLGFRKYGRNLHRFVDEDISQLVNFQVGPTRWFGEELVVNTGIRIPECSEMSFKTEERKRYYPEYRCTMRSSLGMVSGGKDTWFDLHADTNQTIASIIKEIEEVVLPAFEVLNSRQAILAHRREYPQFDSMRRHLILLDETMIYGHLGDLDKARECFDTYYQQQVEEAERELQKKGKAFYGHIEYLDRLAEKNGLR